MAVVNYVDWQGEHLITEISSPPPEVPEIDDTFWSKFENSTRKIDFNDEFLSFIASKLNVESIKPTQMEAHGTQNSHYCLEDNNGKKYILRMGGEVLSDEEKLGERIMSEFQKLKILQNAPHLNDVAFHVYFADDSKTFAPYGYFIGEYVDGTPVGIADKVTDERVVEVARLLKKIHSLDVSYLKESGYSDSSFIYGAPEIIFPENRNAAMEKILSRELFDRVMEEIHDVIPLIKKSHMGLVHGDFHLANMMQTNSGIRAVDWEMSHVGCQVIDIATYTNGNEKFGLSEEQRSLFLKEYGYGSTLEEKLVLWFVSVKRMVFGAYLMETNEEFKKSMPPGMGKYIVSHVGTVLDTKPKD